MPTPFETIKSRVKYSFRQYEGEAEKYRLAVARFKDNSLDGSEVYGEDDVDDTRGVGVINHIRTNIQTKGATIAIGDPDFHLKCDADIDNAVEIATELIRLTWEKLHLTVLGNLCLDNACIGGRGIARCLVDEDGEPSWEHVRKCDFAPDPDAADWNNLRYASCKIKMPREIAIKRYPKYQALFATGRNNAEEQKPIGLTLYFDPETEGVLYKDFEIETAPNHYGELPFHFLDGDRSPDDAHTTGDYDNAQGLETELTEMGMAISSHVKNGSPITLYNGSAIKSRKQLKALETGHQQQLINVGGALKRSIERIPAEQISPVVLQWHQHIGSKLDEAMAVDSTMRGGASDSKFATDIMIQANQSKSRLEQLRIRYERFLREIAQKTIKLLVQFGKPESMEEMYLLTILKAVTELRVVESSTAYKDPTAELQKAKLMLDASVALYTEVGQILTFVPNFELLYKDFIRACEKRNVDQYVIQLQPQVPGTQVASQGASDGTGVVPPSPVPISAGASSIAPAPQAQPIAGQQQTVAGG